MKTKYVLLKVLTSLVALVCYRKMKGVRSKSAREIGLKLNELAVKNVQQAFASMECAIRADSERPGGGGGAELFVEKRSEEEGSSVRNRAHMLKDFENAKMFKTVSDYKRRQGLMGGGCEGSSKKLKKKTRFLLDTFEDGNY
jgi:hypothetical protein